MKPYVICPLQLSGELVWNKSWGPILLRPSKPFCNPCCCQVIAVIEYADCWRLPSHAEVTSCSGKLPSIGCSLMQCCMLYDRLNCMHLCCPGLIRSHACVHAQLPQQCSPDIRACYSTQMGACLQLVPATDHTSNWAAQLPMVVCRSSTITCACYHGRASLQVLKWPISTACLLNFANIAIVQYQLRPKLFCVSSRVAVVAVYSCISMPVHLVAKLYVQESISEVNVTV